MKWYPRDWRADPRLRMCSLAARGLWIEMIGFMHEAEPYGHLTINGASPSIEDIAALVGRPLAEVRKGIAELEARQVFSVTENGKTMFSRRMVRDKAKADRDFANGKGGGNPILSGEDNQGVNPPHNGGDKAQRPEAISHKVFGVCFEESSLSNASLSSSTSSKPRVATAVPGWPADYADQFWAKFPNKIGKASALKKLEKSAKSGRVTFADLMAGLDRYVNKSDDRPWCNPETWINQERWTDVPAPPRPVALPRPGSRDDTRERTAHALRQLSNYVDTHADDEGGGGESGEEHAGYLPLAKPA